MLDVLQVISGAFNIAVSLYVIWLFLRIKSKVKYEKSWMILIVISIIPINYGAILAKDGLFLVLLYSFFIIINLKNLIKFQDYVKHPISGNDYTSPPDPQTIEYAAASKPVSQQEKNKRKNFYRTKQWQKVRYQYLRTLKERYCLLCGAREKDKPLHVDHIRPRSKFPHLQFDLNNLQLLCEDCNLAKGNWYEDDFRSK